MNTQHVGLRRFAKLTSISTLFLIFVGGMVTSTGSGLSVPDWPLSYGTLFPPMVGGVFYEHGHRIVASIVGLCMLILAVWLVRVETRRWVKILGLCALGAVIFQGILGGITVLFFLPTPVSVVHGILAQTFFTLTIIIAYSQSKERQIRENKSEQELDSGVLKRAVFFLSCVYVQLILGAVMRHTHAGLAIPDFPKMGGDIIPQFNQAMLAQINAWRFDMNLDPVTLGQVIIHFLHRAGALLVMVALILLNIWNFRKQHCKNLVYTLYLVDIIVLIQIALGITTVLTWKDPVIASLHVMNGAALLGSTVLFILRVSPLSFSEFKNKLGG